MNHKSNKQISFPDCTLMFIFFTLNEQRANVWKAQKHTTDMPYRLYNSALLGFSLTTTKVSLCCFPRVHEGTTYHTKCQPPHKLMNEAKCSCSSTLHNTSTLKIRLKHAKTPVWSLNMQRWRGSNDEFIIL